MKNLVFICIAIFLFNCNTNQKKMVEIPENEIKQAKAAFLELRQVLTAENGKMWKHSLLGPLMLVNRQTRAIIANEPDANGSLSKHEDVYIGTLPEEVIIANSAIDWNGKRWTIVALPLPEDKADRLSLLIHESFHRIQPLIDFDGLNQSPNNHLDSKDGRIYLKMELEALKKAINADNPEEDIRNALKFRQYRHQLFPGSDTCENSLEMTEGIAEYTASVLCGKNDHDLKMHYISEIDQLYQMPSFVRSFAYFTIPVYGYLMKKIDEKWNLKINKKTHLAQFIAGFYKISLSEISLKEIEMAGKRYKLDSIAAFEENRELERLQLIKQYKAQFLNDEVLIIGLEKMNIGFDPKNIIPLDEHGSVYPNNMKIIDNWGILTVDSCGALVSQNWDKVTISNPIAISDTLISGKGWKLKLNKNYQIQKKGKGFIVVKE